MKPVSGMVRPSQRASGSDSTAGAMERHVWMIPKRPRNAASDSSAGRKSHTRWGAESSV